MSGLARFAIIVGLLLVGAMFAALGRGEKSNEAEEQAIAIVTELTSYPDNDWFYDEAIAMFHDRAFSAAYSSGRRGRSSFDERTYKVILFGEIMQMAKLEGNTEVYEAMKSSIREIQP